MNTKFIFITGGVLSSLGKGLAAASIGAILKARGLNVTIQKLDPYINIDPGTMNPYQHGEVYVTDDGAETDLDLGHYERYLDIALTRRSSTTSGAVYNRVITKERRGDYLGGTVQVIPHITDEIKNAIYSLADGDENSPAPDVAIVEIGGTVGDIEGLPFLEAIRQMRTDIGRNNCLYIHLTLVPYLKVAGELKSKPTQHSVKELRSIGIQPDIILCRCEQAIPLDMKNKLSLFCNVDKDAVFSSVDVPNIYEVPLKFYEEGIDRKIISLLNLNAGEADLSKWQHIAESMRNPKHKVRIAIVGKYVELKEAYKSLHEALVHGGIDERIKIDFVYVNSEELNEKNRANLLADVDGILVPGGFGIRGIEGKIEAINYARVNKIPFFGICLGMQCAVLEFARNVAGISDATSEEFDPLAKNKLIYLMSEWFDVRTNAVEKRDEDSDKGGTMRLGSYPCVLTPNSKTSDAYKEVEIDERHRHRYEFNNAYREVLADNGLIFSGLSPDKNLVEIVEISDHPWFVGCQFHPEFKSSPMSPHPLFKGFVMAARDYSTATKSGANG